MSKKNIILLICVAVVFFVLGFLCRMLVTIGDESERDIAEDIKASSTDALAFSEEKNARIREGYVEYYNGMTWVKVASVEELQLQDSYELAKKNLAEFEADYLEKVEEDYQLVVQEDANRISAPNVGEKKEEGKSGNTNTSGNNISNGASSNSGNNTPTTEAPSGGNSSSTVETPSTPPNTEAPSGDDSSSTTEAPSTPPATEAPPVTEDSGGDGEDIGWSDDYL